MTVNRKSIDPDSRGVQHASGTDGGESTLPDADKPTLHPSIGGETWSADLELGARVHGLIGDYWARIAGTATGDRYRLLVELAGKLYDLHAVKRIELVRPGHVEDASAFDTEHAIRASLAVWQPLVNFQLEDAERQAIDRALAACRSRWMGEALRKVTGTAGEGSDLMIAGCGVLAGLAGL